MTKELHAQTKTDKLQIIMIVCNGDTRFRLKNLARFTLGRGSCLFGVPLGVSYWGMCSFWTS